MARGKKNKKTNSELELLVSVANFDTRDLDILRVVYENVPLKDARNIDGSDYMPSAGTPLNDAVLKFGGLLHENYKRNPNVLHVGLLNDESGSMAGLQHDVIEGVNTFISELRNDKETGGEPGVIMVVMTDGYENSSNEDPDGTKVREFVKAREADGWNFFYLGANQDAWSTGAQQFALGENSTSYTFDHTSGGTGMAFASMSNVVNTRKKVTSDAYAVAATAASPEIQNYVDPKDKLWTPKTDESEE